MLRERARGYEYPPAHVRVEQLGEAVRLIKRMWAEDDLTFHGGHFKAEDACCRPKPPRGIPLMVGGKGNHNFIPKPKR